jgi:hypothetical protein
MRTIPLSLLAAALLVLTLASVPAQAQQSRSFVSSFGNDANNCDRATPCRTFQGAHDKTNDLGEITVLDAGGYGAVTITKSILIVNDGRRGRHPGVHSPIARLDTESPCGG